MRVKNQRITEIKNLEKEAVAKWEQSPFRNAFHLMPPVGWLNDPNGLCQRKGVYHIFFQYAPFDAEGGDKYWGHYETKDFIEYTYTGIFLSPDCEWDKDGAFSGSAYVEEDEIYIFYTGNTEEGEGDLVYEGRGANTILVTTKDGIKSSEKHCLLANEDYPKELSCHVRDPKVFKVDDTYYMVLGGRTREDKGCILIYKSQDKRSWEFLKLLAAKEEEPFGYMWECPDLFQMADKWCLSFSPQGVETKEHCFQNVYQSGYCILQERVIPEKSKMITQEGIRIEDFKEWDYGFDFYAPQTFLDEKGRRILIGWMGMGDAAYSNPTVGEGWQHCLTMPRVLTLSEEKETLLQNPIEEMLSLRDHVILEIENQDNPLQPEEAKDRERVSAEWEGCFELCMNMEPGTDFAVTLDRSLKFSYQAEKGMLSLCFLPQEECGKEDAKGYARTERTALIDKEKGVSDIRMFVDNSCVEIYINKGEIVFSSRYYKTDKKHTLVVEGNCSLKAYALREFCYKGME